VQTWVEPQEQLKVTMPPKKKVAGRSNLHSGRKKGTWPLLGPKESDIQAQDGIEVSLQHERFLTVLEHLPIYIYLRNMDHDIIFANQLFRNYFGDPSGKKCFEVLVGGSKPCRVCRPSKVLTEKRQQQWEWTEPHIERTFHVFCYKLKDFDGQILILEVGIDITGQKTAERQQAHLVSAIDQASEALILANAEGTIIYANPAFENITGRSADEIIHSSLTSFVEESLDPLRVPGFEKAFNDGLAWRSEISKSRPDGHRYDIEISVIPVCDHHVSGTINNFVVIIRDITEEKKLKWHLDQKKKLEALGTLARSIAHDFNNILAPIIINSELVLSNLAEGSSERSSVALVLKAAIRGRELVDQILAFARPSDRQTRHFRLVPLIEKILTELRSTLPDNIDLLTSFNVGDDDFEGNPVQIEQIISNLCQNSIKAMKAAGGSLEVSLSTRIHEKSPHKHLPDSITGDFFLLSVKDSGTGINPEHLELIFEPFYTTREKGKGYGLGLAIVHTIVTGLGGMITINNNPGSGCEFLVYLPRSPVSQAGPKDEAELSQPRTESIRILIVDDDKQARDILQIILEQQDHTVVSVDGAVQALSLILKPSEHFDLVITDYLMPELNGLELAKRIKDSGLTVPIILSSGLQQKDFQRLGLSLADVLFVGKPYSESELHTLIQTVLSRH